jgi:hypothetical protein
MLTASAAYAAQYVYPAQGQDSAKQASDEAACTTWATQQTGFDPAKAPAQSAASPLTGAPATAAISALSGGNPTLGAVTGALASPTAPGAPSGGLGGTAATTAISAVTGGNPTLGAAAGALAGSLGQTSGTAQAATPGRADFDKARAACLAGKGYTVQ